MQYHLKEYLAAFPNMVSHRVFNTWKEVIKEFGEECAIADYGINGEFCPNKLEGIELRGEGDTREDGVQEFYVTDDDGNPVLKSFEVHVDYTTIRTATFLVDAQTAKDAEEKVDAMAHDSHFTGIPHCGSEIEICRVDEVDPIRQHFGTLSDPCISPNTDHQSPSSSSHATQPHLSSSAHSRQSSHPREIMV